MSHARRDSFEALDLETIEKEEVTEESGPRRLPAPRGAWSDAPPPIPKHALPPPAPRARDAADEDPSAPWAAETIEASRGERLDLDELVRDLSTRPPPPSEKWELPAGSLAGSAMAPRAARTLPIWAWIAGMVATYLLGFGTAGMLELTAPAPTAPSTNDAIGAGETMDRAAAEEVAHEPAPAIAAGEESTESAELPSTAVDEPASPPAARVEDHAPHAARARERTTELAPVDEPRPDTEDRPEAIDRVEASGAALVDSPERDDVQGAMAAVEPTIEACASSADRGQLARVRFTFASDGRPIHTVVEGVAGSTASCIARAARTVRLPPFARERFVVEFPFQL